MVPESQNNKPSRYQYFVPLRIVPRMFRVLAAIQLDNDFSGKTYEVEDVVLVRMLPSEPGIVELLATQVLPKDVLSIGGCVAKLALQLCLKDLVACLSVHGRFPGFREITLSGLGGQPSPPNPSGPRAQPSGVRSGANQWFANTRPHPHEGEGLSAVSTPFLNEMAFRRCRIGHSPSQ